MRRGQQSRCGPDCCKVQSININGTLRIKEFKEHDFPSILMKSGLRTSYFRPHLKGSEKAVAHMICEEKISNYWETREQP